MKHYGEFSELSFFPHSFKNVDIFYAVFKISQYLFLKQNDTSLFNVPYEDIFLEELDNIVIDFNLTDLYACDKQDWEL